jgi:FdhD protein
VEETPWWLEVNGQRVTGGTTTPDRLRALAAGRLLADGFIQVRDELLALDVEAAPAGTLLLRARIPPQRAMEAHAEHAHRITNACGLLHFVSCNPSSIRRPRRAAPPDSEGLSARFRELFAVAQEASDVGGLHAAAVTDGNVLLNAVEDIGRHNAVDKAIGAAFLDGRTLSDLGLVLTARISAEIALKAARSGIAWLASRSIATTLAVAIAEVARLPMVGRAASKEAHSYFTFPAEDPRA